jgi:hypothetical protein
MVDVNMYSKRFASVYVGFTHLIIPDSERRGSAGLR